MPDTQIDPKTLKPILSKEERDKLLADIDAAYKAMGYDPDQFVKIPVKYISKIGQVASEATAAAIVQPLRKMMDENKEAMQAYLIQNILPEDYKREEQICSELARLDRECKSMRMLIKGMSDVLDEHVASEPYAQDSK